MKPHPLGPPFQKIWRGGRNRTEGKISVNQRNLRETTSLEHLDFEHYNLFRISILEFRIFKLTSENFIKKIRVHPRNPCSILNQCLSVQICG